MLKHVAHHCQDFSCTISDMRSFIHSDGNMATAPSQVYYMELINENPDSDETMCLVAEDLLEKFDITEQNG